METQVGGPVRSSRPRRRTRENEMKLRVVTPLITFECEYDEWMTGDGIPRNLAPPIGKLTAHAMEVHTHVEDGQKKEDAADDQP
jgi:hypothetical protein